MGNNNSYCNVANKRNKMKTMKDLLRELQKQAKEEIELGNSKEKQFGYGIKYTIETIKNYCKKNNIRLEL